MKKVIWMIGLIVLAGISPARAQRQEAQQLMLNLTKLEQFRQILEDMRKGYEILVKGYGMVKDISEGNFSLHKVFLDALMDVSPAVAKYRKIAEIVDMQVKIVRRYRTAYDRFRESGQFSAEEILYLGRVYGRLTDRSLRNLEGVLNVVTTGQMRMSDAERLAAIDAIHAEVFDQLSFLHDFNNRTAVLAAQRRRENAETGRLKQLY